MTTQRAIQTVPGRNGTVCPCISTPPTPKEPVKYIERPCRTVPFLCRGTPGGDRAGVPPPYRGHARHAHPSPSTRPTQIRHGQRQRPTPTPTNGA